MNRRRVRLPKPVLGALVAGEVVSAVLAWRDLGRRTDERVRGRKRWWRVLLILNPGNSLIYWAVGRVGAQAGR